MATSSTGTTKFVVTYEDGTVETFKVKPRHLIEFEDQVGFGEDSSPSLRDNFKLTYIASQSPLTYEGWLNTVDEIETDTPDAPTPTASIAVDGGEAKAVPTESL